VVWVAQFPDDGYRRWGIAAALLIAAVPLLQLLPLPASGWNLPNARDALAADLAQAGVASFPKHWTLTLQSTETALWALMPALAAFLAAMALHARHRRRVLQAIVLLIVLNVAFAFFQAGLPQGSQLRLYKDFEAGFGGLLVNTNHQATACIIGMLLAVGLAVEAHGRAERGETRPHMHFWYAGLAAALLLMVPLSTARAGMPIAFASLALVLALTGVLRLSRIGRSKRTTLLAVALAVVAVIGVRVAIGWTAVDQAEELRHTMTAAAVSAGTAQAPVGSGVGSFVPVFEQSAPSALWLSRYVNHAHNEYAQWWLEAGWLGMLALGVALSLLAFCGWRLALLQVRGSNAALAAACFVSVCAVLAHSWVDFPLRTLTLMTTTAALAGLTLATLQEAHSRDTSLRRIRHEHAEAARLAHHDASQ
jgi:O-antigen ligase